MSVSKKYSSKVRAAIVACTLLSLQVVLAQPIDTLWMKFYPDWDGNDRCERLIRTADGGFMIGGYTGYPWRQYLIIKLDSHFEMEWANRYYDPQYHVFFGGIAQMPDGEFIVSGEGRHNDVNYAGLLRLNSEGDTVWVNGYGTTEFNDVTLSSDGLPVAAGTTNEHAEHGSYDAWLLKADDNGELIWSRVYGGESGDRFFKVMLTEDRGFAAVGETGSSGLIVKVDSLGRQQWLSAVSSGGGAHSFSCVAQTSNGGYIAGGAGNVTINDVRDTQYYVVRFSSEGDTIWSRKWGSQRNGTDYIQDIINAPGGGYLVVGYGADWGYAVFRLDEDGEVLWEFPFEGRHVSDQFFAGLIMDDGGYLLGGWAGTREREQEVLLVRTTPDMTYNSVRLIDPVTPLQITLTQPYPNPFNSSVNIEYSLPVARSLHLTIHDASGRQLITLFNGVQTGGAHRIVWLTENVPAGTYFLNTYFNGESVVRPLTLVR